MRIQKDKFNYHVTITDDDDENDTQNYYYINVDDICKSPELADSGFTLKRWQVFNLLRGKYTGNKNDKWRRIKVVRLLEPLSIE